MRSGKRSRNRASTDPKQLELIVMGYLQLAPPPPTAQTYPQARHCSLPPRLPLPPHRFPPPIPAGGRLRLRARRPTHATPRLHARLLVRLLSRRKTVTS